jgi:hypothetical protein
MSAPADELEQTYRRTYHRLIVGVWLICAILLCAIVLTVGESPVVSTIMNQLWSDIPYTRSSARPGPPAIKAAPSCRQRGSWSTVWTATSGQKGRQHDEYYASLWLILASVDGQSGRPVLKSPLFTSS